MGSLSANNPSLVLLSLSRRAGKLGWQTVWHFRPAGSPSLPCQAGWQASLDACATSPLRMQQISTPNLARASSSLPDRDQPERPSAGFPQPASLLNLMIDGFAGGINYEPTNNKCQQVLLRLRRLETFAFERRRRRRRVQFARA